VSAFALLPSCIRYALPQNLWQIKTGRVQKNDAPTEATQHGNKMEPIARLLYQNLMRCDVLPSPFKKHPYLLIGAEPDGLVPGIKATTNFDEKPRLVEIKCPLYARTWEHIPAEYIAQTQVQMEVWDIDICDVVCFFQASSFLKIIRVYRSSQYWKWIKPRLSTFIEHVEKNVEITKEKIPFIGHIVQEYMQNNYNYGSLCSPPPRSDLPPKVFTQTIQYIPVPQSMLKDLSSKLTTVTKPHEYSILYWIVVALTGFLTMMWLVRGVE